MLYTFVKCKLKANFIIQINRYRHRKDSILRQKVTLEAMESFQWSDLNKEMEESLPWVHELLKSIFPPVKHLQTQRVKGRRGNKK